MDKNAIRKYAVWARRELIGQVSQRALQYGISENGCGDKDADTINGHLLTAAEKRQRQALISKISKDGYHQVMEEAAYTWFNRFSALRYMEVNGLVPSRVRVFTDEQNSFNPQIVAEAINLSLDGLDMERVFALKEASRTEELFKYLLITQCNALSAILPGLFQKIEDYTELLFPDNMLREESVIGQMIALIPQEDWTDQVQIIGWLYQYYNTELKDAVFAGLKDNIKISREDIPAATQLFTPDWIVRYMVENSLGRLWLEGHPDDKLKKGWNYYLEEAEQKPEVQAQLEAIRREYAKIEPEDIRVIDPCMGSGHILVVMFDVLMQIYASRGYTASDAAYLIVEKNLWGLDIDERAAQLAYFAVMMKARQYDRGFFRRKVQPNVYAIEESNGINREGEEYRLFVNGNAGLEKALGTIMDELYDAKEYGSVLNVTKVDFEALYKRAAETESDSSLAHDVVRKRILPLIKVAEALARKYDVVCTNPPYMGSSGMGSKLSKFVKKHYPDSKSDMFAVFIERCRQMARERGYQAMITQHAWMFLSSYEKLRSKLLSTDIVSMAHLGARAFEEIGGEVVQTTSFVMCNSHVDEYKGVYCRLIEPTTQQGKEEMFLAGENRYAAEQSNFSKIPGAPVAYWVSERMQLPYSTGEKLLGEVATPRAGLATGNNTIFQRMWYEVVFSRIGFGVSSVADTVSRPEKWYPCNSGGIFRKWATDNIVVVNWYKNGTEIKFFRNDDGKQGSRPQNTQWYFKEGLTWNKLSSSNFAVKYKNAGFIFDDTSRSAFPNDKIFLKYIVGLLCSNVSFNYLKVLNPTMSFTNGDLTRIPIIFNNGLRGKIDLLVDNCILLSRTDWDSYETSWDFSHHPLVRKVSKIADAYSQWKEECESRFLQLKKNEEELNRIFIDIYGLQDELTPDVADKDITVHRIFDTRDDVPDSMKGSSYIRTKRDEIVSLISYAVGCMFGRYSLDEDGLVFAGGEFDSSRYKTYAADPDNIIPVCDDDYFIDDITGLFVKWVETVYGSDALEENLKYIADALGGKGLARNVIRSYFLNGFYADHVKTYQKRPIYWLFDSGKKNGFKALIYMHRYKEDTLACVRIDYVHGQQSRYRTRIEEIQQLMSEAQGAERVKLGKLLARFEAQAEEIRLYEEKVHHLADRMTSIDLDDGVKANYARFADVLAKIK